MEKEQIPEKVMTDLGLLSVASQQDEKNNLNQQQQTMYKEHLSLLIARGKTKEFIGKNITYSDLDKMSPKELEKYFRLYEAAQASKINESVTNGVINAYTKLCGIVTKTDAKNLKKLNDDLKNDFLVRNELEMWTSYLSFKMGSLMSLVSAGLITFQNIHTINDGAGGSDTEQPTTNPRNQPTTDTKDDDKETKVSQTN